MDKEEEDRFTWNPCVHVLRIFSIKNPQILSISTNIHGPYLCDPLGPYISLVNNSIDQITLFFIFQMTPRDDVCVRMCVRMCVHVRARMCVDTSENTIVGCKNLCIKQIYTQLFKI